MEDWMEAEITYNGHSASGKFRITKKPKVQRMIDTSVFGRRSAVPGPLEPPEGVFKFDDDDASHFPVDAEIDLAIGERASVSAKVTATTKEGSLELRYFPD